LPLAVKPLYHVKKPQRCRRVVFRYPAKAGVNIAIDSWRNADGFHEPELSRWRFAFQ
jgi:hypothetical protein